MEKEVISYQRTNKQMYPARFIEKEHRTCVYPGAYAYLTRVNVFVLILVLMLMFASYVWQTAFTVMNISYAQDKKYEESYLCENVAQN